MIPEPLHVVAGRLQVELRAAYAGDAGGAVGAAPLRAAFARFGHAANAALIPLEDAMAAGVDVLQTLLDDGGAFADQSVTLAAGVALAALARAYANAERDHPEDDGLGKAPMEWLAALHRINRLATADLELRPRLETSVRVVAETLGADACAVALYDEGTGLLVLRAAVGLNPASIGVVAGRPGLGITGRAVSEGRVIAAPDAREHPDYVAFPTTGEELYVSQVSVPLLIRRGDEPDRLVGALVILCAERREFPTDEIAFLETLADELAISIENARLYSQTDARLQQKIAELGTLQRVSHTIASTLDLDHVLRSIAEQAAQLIRVESASIFRLPSARRGSRSAPTIEYRVGTNRQVLDDGRRNTALTAIARSGAPQEIDLDYADGSGRLFCLPLRSARETVGALCLRLAPEADLSEDQLALLQAFSDSATLAIENATLYQDALQGYVTASALLQEMHHRVRNNLQTVAALLSLQLRKNEDAPWADNLRDAVSRVQAIASIHDLLSDEQRLAGTTVDVIARHVANETHRTLVPPGMRVTFEIPPSDVMVPSRQATVLALLINELVANAVRHGFSGRERGRVRIGARCVDGQALVEVANDGWGPPAGFDPGQSAGLGMRIIQRLVSSDLGGSFEIRAEHPGTVATIAFPLVTEEFAAIER